MFTYRKAAAEQLRVVMQELRISGEDLAQDIGISQEMMTNIATGTARPSRNTLEKLLGSLNLDDMEQIDHRQIYVLYALDGGQKLRDLRNTRNISQEDLATDATIVTKSLSDIELGKTYQPSKDVLDRLLEALDAEDHVSLQDRQFVYAAYGYRAPYPRPREHEIDQAKKIFFENYANVPYPAYLLDCLQRLHGWNIYAPKLVGLSVDDPQTFDFAGVTIFDVTFGLASSYITIVNREQYLPDLLRSSRTQELRFSQEDWYEPYIQEEKQKHPEFAALWDEIDESTLDITSLGNNVPIELDIPNTGTLTFRLMRLNYDGDPRFFVVQWIPVDPATMTQCLKWVSEEQSKR